MCLLMLSFLQSFLIARESDRLDIKPFYLNDKVNFGILSDGIKKHRQW